jgi:hypothetical protein
VVNCLLFFAAIQYFFWKFHQKGIAMGFTPDHMFFGFLMEQKEFMNRVTFVSCFSVVAFTTLFGMILSNRIAGPIYRIQNYLKQKMNGKAQGPLTFREKDFFPELAQTVSEFTQSSKKN